MKKKLHVIIVLALVWVSSTQVMAQTVTGTLRDSLHKDLNSNGIANPDDSIKYIGKIKVTGAAATSVNYNAATPANTTLGSDVKTSPLARNDAFSTAYNTVTSSNNVLTNDFGVPSPTVASYGTTSSPNTTSPGGTGASNNGGTVVITAGGALTYTPPTNFVGYDQFAYKASNGNNPTNNAVVTITVGTAASASNNSYNVIGNVGIIPNATQGILTNDAGTNIVVETVNGSASNVGNATATANGGTVTVSADGSFTYSPKAGWEGTDNFTYTCDNDLNTPASATVSLIVSDMVWFINSSYSGSTEDGRLGTPFKTMNGFALVNDGVGDHPNTGEGIFVFTGTTYADGSPVLTGQSLLGQGGTVTVDSYFGLSLEAYTATLPTTSGTNPNIGGTITLSSGNSLRGFTLGNTASTSLSGSSFGTLSLSEVTISNANGGAISLTTGTCNCTFVGVTSGAGSNNISLTSVGGTITMGSGALSGSSGNAFVVNGGSNAITYSGSITNTTADAINITNRTGGSITLSGNISNTGSGTGITLSSNSGGTITLSGGSKTLTTGANDAVSLSSNNGCTIDFSNGGLNLTTTTGSAFVAIGGATAINVSGSGNSITTSGAGSGGAITVTSCPINLTWATVNTVSSAGGIISLTSATGSLTINGGTLNGAAGNAVAVNGGTVSITCASNITFNTASVAAVNISGGHSGGTITFQTGTLNITGGTGLQFDNADGTYNFNGTTTLNGGDAGIDILNGSGGTFSFSTGTAITTPTGIAFNISGTASTCGVTYSGDITYSTASTAIVNISGGHNTGAIIFQTGTLSATNGTGLQFDNADGTYNFNGTTTLNGSGDEGIDILNGSSGTFSFGTNASITSPSGIAFNISGTASTCAVTYSGAITHATNTAMVNISGGHNTGTITFQTGTLSATNGTGLQFDNADGSYNFNGTTTLNGSGDEGIDILNGSAGTFSFGSNTSITSPSGIAFNVDGTSTAVTSAITYNGSITHATAGTAMVSITAHSTGTVTFQTGTLSATDGTGLQFNNADAIYNFSGTCTLNGGDAGVDITNGSAGNFTFSNTNITTPSGAAFLVSGGNGSIGHTGTITKTSSGRLVDIQSRTGGSVTLTGNLSATTSCTGINVSSCSGGTITFSGSTKTMNTPGSNPINLAINGGTTINFSNGGLAITSTTATGFNATGGATAINVTGSNNIITSTTGIALNVISTGIGSSNLNFLSISANGGSKGITLYRTGSSGGLIITGTGTTAGSGGTIQNISTRGLELRATHNVSISNMNLTSACTADNPSGPTGLSTGVNTADNAAIHLDSVKTITLDRINISGSAEHGINGHNVNGFNLTNSTIASAGGGPDEDGIHFFNMSGTCNLTNNTISGSGDDNVIIQNNTNLSAISSSGTINISGGSYNTGGLGSGILFGIRGTSNTTINISGVTINNNFSGGVVSDCYDGATMDVEVSTTTITNNNDAIAISSHDGNTVFDIHDNSNLSGQDFVNISILKSAFSTGGTLSGKIRDNNITTEDGHAADGIFVFAAGGGTLKIAITDNTMFYRGTQRAILLQGGQDGACTMETTVTGNSIDMQLDGTGNAAAGILSQVIVATPGGNGTTLCTDIGGAGSLKNVFTHSLGGTMAAGDIRVRQRNGGPVKLPGYGGSGSDNAAVVSYLDARNTVISTSTATNDNGTFSGGSACQQP